MTNQSFSPGGLEAQLDQIEASYGKLAPGDSALLFAMLKEMDAVNLALQTLDPDSRTYKERNSQFVSLQNLIRSNARKLIRVAGGPGAFAEARNTHAPATTNEWWRLDELEAERIKAQGKAWGIRLGVAALILAVLGFLYIQFLAPDEATAARYTHQYNAENYALEQDYQTALDEVEQGLAYPPADPYLLAFKGVLLEALGRADEAALAYQAALEGSPDELSYWVNRAQAHQATGNPEASLQDSQRAIAVDPSAAAPYLFMGNAYDELGQPQAGIEALEKCSELATQNGQNELAAQARVRMAYMMQSAQMPTFPSTETPLP